MREQIAFLRGLVATGRDWFAARGRRDVGAPAARLDHRLN
jgi:hypothetical protein